MKKKKKKKRFELHVPTAKIYMTLKQTNTVW